MARQTILVSDVSGKPFADPNEVVVIRFFTNIEEMEFVKMRKGIKTGEEYLDRIKGFKTHEVALTKQELADILGMELRTDEDRRRADEEAEKANERRDQSDISW